MSEERIKTPEECYQLTYKRNIAIGEMWLKQHPQPTYQEAKGYIFEFDKDSTYKWLHRDLDNNDYFERSSDGTTAIFTKYSHINFN